MIAINVKTRKVQNVSLASSSPMCLFLWRFFVWFSLRNTLYFFFWITPLPATSISYSSEWHLNPPKYTKNLKFPSLTQNKRKIENKKRKYSPFSLKNSRYWKEYWGLNQKNHQKREGKVKRIIRHDKNWRSRRIMKRYFIRKRRRKFRKGCRKGIYRRRE